ncbi:hypothetical protein ACRRTK_002186 [Alexandromys fortis]
MTIEGSTESVGGSHGIWDVTTGGRTTWKREEWRDGLTVKGPGCSPRRPEFDFQIHMLSHNYL